jgi:hypothetical protein
VKTFAAPWCLALKIASAFTVVILVGVLAALVTAGAAGSGWGILALAGVGALLLVSPLFAVTGYSIESGELRIRRPGWSVSRDLSELESAALDPNALAGSIRLFGNGGLFSITGLFWNRRLGRYRAFITDPRRAVVLRFRSRPVVVSPDDPHAFLAALPERVRR